jgi:hypothetical protein
MKRGRRRAVECVGTLARSGGCNAESVTERVNHGAREFANLRHFRGPQEGG